MNTIVLSTHKTSGAPRNNGRIFGQEEGDAEDESGTAAMLCETWGHSHSNSDILQYTLMLALHNMFIIRLTL